MLSDLNTGLFRIFASRLSIAYTTAQTTKERPAIGRAISTDITYPPENSERKAEDPMVRTMINSVSERITKKKGSKAAKPKGNLASSLLNSSDTTYPEPRMNRL